MPRVCEPECPVLVSLWADFAIFMSQSPARSLFESYRDRKGRLGCPCWAFPPPYVEPIMLTVLRERPTKELVVGTQGFSCLLEGPLPPQPERITFHL